MRNSLLELRDKEDWWKNCKLNTFRMQYCTMKIKTNKTQHAQQQQQTNTTLTKSYCLNQRPCVPWRSRHCTPPWTPEFQRKLFILLKVVIRSALVKSLTLTVCVVSCGALLSVRVSVCGFCLSLMFLHGHQSAWSTDVDNYS